MNNTTVSKRLERVQEALGISARAIDRVAEKAEGTFAILVKKNSNSILRGTLEPYAAKLEIRLEWLMLGVGDEPNWSDIRVRLGIPAVNDTPTEPPKRPSGTFSQVSADALPTATAIYEAPSSQPAHAVAKAG